MALKNGKKHAESDRKNIAEGVRDQPGTGQKGLQPKGDLSGSGGTALVLGKTGGGKGKGRRAVPTGGKNLGS